MSRRTFVFAILLFGGITAVSAAAQGNAAAIATGSPQTALPAQFSQWLSADVPWIISEKERDVFLKLRSDRERDIFIESFWRQRDPDPATPENEFQVEHYRRLSEADRKFGAPGTAGRMTARGRIFVLLGEPKTISWEAIKAGGPETEVWTYEIRPKNGVPIIHTVGFTGEESPQAGPLYLERCNMKMRVFEGLAEGQAAPATAVTSSSLTHTVSATIQPDEDLEAQQKRIQQVFNLKSVKQLTETNLIWENGRLDKGFHFFRVGERTYLVQVTPTDVAQRKFRVEVLEQTDGSRAGLFDTEAGFPKNIWSVFGFRDAQGRSYFVSLHVLEWYVEGNAPVPPKPAAARVTPIPAEGPVRAVGEIRPPRLVKQVNPVYPPLARQARIEGMIILEVTTDIYGRIMTAKVLRSIPLLDQAAIDAVRQWVYEPVIIQGRPREMTFTVTVRFTLDERRMGPQTAVTYSPADARLALKAVKEVQAVYPETALTANAQGTVILEGVIDEAGKVTDVKILRSVQPPLDRAAENAVKEWRFDPVLEGGKPKSTAVIFSVKFWISTDSSAIARVGGVMGGVVGGVMGGVEGGVAGGVAGGVVGGTLGGVVGEVEPPVRAEGAIRPPRQVKRVDPVYPEVARQSRVEGEVILELTTDIYGRVQSAKVLRSIPLLDQAAIDAVRQWVYEPLIIDGKPRACVFTATVRFAGK